MGKQNAEILDDARETLELKCKEFPNSKVLLISSRRPGTFLIRTASELLAGGTEVLILSALGDAMPLAIQLQMALLNKDAATTIRIETSLNKRTNPRGKHDMYTPGLQIYMRKHVDFKGSRISPGYVSFAPKPLDGMHTPIYDEKASERFCTVIAGDPTLYVGGTGINGRLAKALGQAGQDYAAYKTLFTTLLKEAKAAHAADEGTFMATMAKSKFQHPDLKFCFCRLPRNRSLFKGESEGCVFVSIFKSKFPFGNPNNMGFIYVVGPNGANYSSAAEFHIAVHEASENLMTSVCDYNGMVKRSESKTLQWLVSCRMCLFSGGSFMHKDSSKLEVAMNILNGIAEGYRHGPASRFNFAYDDDVYKQAWAQTTGLKPPGST